MASRLKERERERERESERVCERDVDSVFVAAYRYDC